MHHICREHGIHSTLVTLVDLAAIFGSQAHGRKRFRLWGPDAHAALRVFPDAHPRARKAQVLIDSDPGVPKAELDVTLEAGEALFIPAFWFHHVEALSPSVSVNVFSENSMKLAAQTITSMAMMNS